MSHQWPSWATQQIEVIEPNPHWQQWATELVSDLQDLLAPWLVGEVEHIGSTAVAGLPAKPVIDLMAPVASLVESETAETGLRGSGWHLVPPELDQRPWRRMYVLPDGDRRLAHLHLLEPDHQRWRDALVFRDRLRAHPDLAAEYARIKRMAAQAHPQDREAYSRAKSTFIEDVVARGEE